MGREAIAQFEVGDSMSDASTKDTNGLSELKKILERPRDEVVKECEHTIVGQNAVVEQVVDLLYVCLQRMRMRAAGTDELDLPRACSFMLVGSTASGKSFIMKVVARVMGITLVNIDCTGITGAGWAGDSVSSELRRVGHTLDQHPGQPVIAFWDEADKLVRSTEGNQRGFDAQGNLLKLLDGEEMMLEPSEPGQQEMTLNTSLILNVFAGAFSGIEKLVHKRLISHHVTVSNLKTHPDLMDLNELYRQVNLQDIISWGFMPELVGRFGAVVSVPSLSVDSLHRIVKGSERSLEHRITNLLGVGREFVITDAAAQLIAHEAKRSGLGARRIDQLSNRFIAQALVMLQNKKDANRVTLDTDEEGSFKLTADTNGELAKEAVEAQKEAAQEASSVAQALESQEELTNIFTPDAKLIAGVDQAVAGSRWSEASKTREGAELLAQRLCSYQSWRQKDEHELIAAQLLTRAVIGYLNVKSGSQSLGKVIAYIKLSNVHLKEGYTYLDLLFFGRVDLCGIRGLEEEAQSDPALCTPDILTTLSCYRRFLSYPEDVRKLAANLACARALSAAKSPTEAQWLRSDINEVSDALDKDMPFEQGQGMPLMF